MKEQVRLAYEKKEAEVEQMQPGLMRQAERFFILQQIDYVCGESTYSKWMHCVSQLAYGGMVKRIRCWNTRAKAMSISWK